MWTVSVWDDRDTDATEPESSLGDFPSEQKAERALEHYLTTDNGGHIYRFRVWNRDEGGFNGVDIKP